MCIICIASSTQNNIIYRYAIKILKSSSQKIKKSMEFVVLNIYTYIYIFLNYAFNNINNNNNDDDDDDDDAIDDDNDDGGGGGENDDVGGGVDNDDDDI